MRLRRGAGWRLSRTQRPRLLPDVMGTQTYRFSPMISGPGTGLRAIERLPAAARSASITLGEDVRVAGVIAVRFDAGAGPLIAAL